MINFHNIIWYFKHLNCGLLIGRKPQFYFQPKVFKFGVFHFWWYVEYHIKCGVQLDENNRATVCGCKVKWFANHVVCSATERGAAREAIKFWEVIHPIYKGYIGVY